MDFLSLPGLAWCTYEVKPFCLVSWVEIWDGDYAG